MSPEARESLPVAAFVLVASLVAASDSVESCPLAAAQFIRYLLAGGVLLAIAHWRSRRPGAVGYIGLVAADGRAWSPR